MMITTKDIVDALQDIALESLPELKKVYIDIVPKGAKRPCLLIEPVTSSPRGAAKNLLRRTEYYALTLYDTTDDYDRSSTMRLLDMRDRLMQPLLLGYLPVKGRAPAIQASTGGRNFDKAYIDLQLEFHDLRAQHPGPGPLMESLDLELTRKG